MKTFRDVLDLIGCSALAEHLGLPAVTVRQWRFRNSIPSSRFVGVAQAARTAAETETDPERADALKSVSVGLLAQLAAERGQAA